MTERLEQVLRTIREEYAVDAEYVRAAESAIEAHRRAEDEFVAREIVGRLPNRLVHEVRNAWVYRESEVTPPIDADEVRNDPTATQHWYPRADKINVSVEPLGIPSEYVGFDPIEDVALAPRVNWTDADKKAAFEKAIKTYGIEPGQWLDLDWPPTGHLSDPGHVYTTDFVPCALHEAAYYEDDRFHETACDKCQSSIREVVEFPAKWKWTTTLRTNEIQFDLDGTEDYREVDVDAFFEVTTTEQDPRQVLIGPPGRGSRW